ncbi:MAG: zinc-dependent metalloprotease [Pirellulales bacterium]|nr:zinc-dependent metalloprotease [Pirellulales bacterium]
MDFRLWQSWQQGQNVFNTWGNFAPSQNFRWRSTLAVGALIFGLAGILPATYAVADNPSPAPAPAVSPATPPTSPATTAKPDLNTIKAGDDDSSDDAKGSDGDGDKPKYPPFGNVIKDAKKISGLLTLYKRENQLFAEIPGGMLNKDLIMVISIAKGIGQQPLLGGMSWSFGDDSVLQFRKVDDTIRIIRRNVRFTADANSPEKNAVGHAYTDSVLFSLPIATMAPSGAPVVDLTPVFMSDFPQISMVLPGFAFAANKSNWALVKSYPDNVELQVAATYASGGNQEIDTVADSRGVTIHVHYSISVLPSTGYRPRLADDRVGYFLTVQKDYSHKNEEDRFIRYVNRWDLQKADPGADISPPKKPIIFWLEKTIPYKFRKPIRDGILEWNKAFEKAGFYNAVEVRQQPDNADWEPEDINYNTFRWITSSNGFAMGPSRVNPLTGQILDADIIFDADFLQSWKREYETFTPESIAAMTGGPNDLRGYQLFMKQRKGLDHLSNCQDCQLSYGRGMDMAFGGAMLFAKDPALAEAEKEKLMMQGIKEITMHEVGHTLGLRHNFKSSTVYSLADLHDTSKTSETGLTASVMDYAPVNIAQKDAKQGDFYSTTIGPYDMWAIEYGYKPVSGNSPEGELPELKKIAARSGEPALAYSTDEDTRGVDPDPLSNRFDLGKDPLEYAQNQAKLISGLWEGVVERMVPEGEGYQKARQTFGMLLSKYGMAMFMASRNIGGLYVHRGHKGDKDAPAPFVVVDANKQRETLKMLDEQVFSDKPFSFPPVLYNYLASTRWSHWGTSTPLRTELAIHDTVAMWQERILSQLLSPLTLERLYDSELRISRDEDAFTVAELLKKLTSSIFSEVDKLPDGEFTDRKPAISSLRRNLQRQYLDRLTKIALGQTDAPNDCRSLAQLELKNLNERLTKNLAANPKLDSYTLAHLTEVQSYIGKVLNANVQLNSGGGGGGGLFHLLLGKEGE